MQILKWGRARAAVAPLRASQCAGIVVACAGIAGMAAAQPMQPHQEYDKRLRSAEQVGALTSDLFGDAVNVYDQSTTFHQTDIDLPGTNALPVRLSRSLNVRPVPAYGIIPKTYAGAADWNIDIPYVSGVFDSAFRWNVTVTGNTPRCSSAFYPRTELPNKIEDIWSGYTVNLPGQGARSLVAMPPDEFKRPDGQPHVWTTTSLDSITCTSMAGGYPGEGFVLQTIDGITYTFNVATERAMGAMARDSGGAGRQRVEIFLMASRIQDRFGNFVDISYNGNGHPTKVSASDGRQINLQYSGDRLASASAHGRTWTYAYSGDTLQRVTQPDQTGWEFAHLEDRRIDYYLWQEDIGPGCGNVAPLKDKIYRVQMRHPSGALATFRFDHQRLSRSGVPGILCQGEVLGGSIGTGFPVVHFTPVPTWFDVLGLTEKTIEGPGLPSPLRWHYMDLGDHYEPWSGNVPPCTTCVQSKVVRITQPDGSRVDETYGVVYSLNEGKMLARSTVAADGTTLESETLSYVSTTQASSMPFPDRYGSRWGGSDESSVLVRPLARKVIVRDGVMLAWEATLFDAKARPVKVTRSSTLGHSRTDTTAYHDNTAAWLLGQTASLTNNDTGLTETHTSFNGQGLPVEQRQFGKLVQTLSYHADGALSSVADGRGNVTTLNNWKRGTPQAIGFADGNGLSATVDDNGWIRSVTNELGYQTSYDYDAMGRIAATVFASGDSVAWNARTQVFERVNMDEHGIAPGHWRLSSSTGNRRKTIWFDAMWRPLITREFDAGNVADTERYQRFSYDHAGRPTFQSYPGATPNLTTGQWSEYDALGRPTSNSVDSELGLLTTVTEYLSSLRTRTTNPRGHKTVTSHQAFDTPNYDAPTRIEHPAGAFTEIARDGFGKPTSIKRRNADGSVAITRSYVYDGQQQLCKSVEPESGATAMAYDAAGNLVWSAAGLALTAANGCETAIAQASGRRVDRSYDNRNRLSQLSFPDGNGNQAWSYNAAGKPSQVVTENAGSRQVVNTYAYNKRGLITGETMQQQGVGVWSMGYGYDANAALASLQYPSGLHVALVPNALGQPTQVGSHASAVRYYPNGGLRSFTYGNGVTHAMTQNLRALPARAIDAGVLDGTITYDANGNVATVTDGVEAGKSRQMQYDALDRLTQATSAAFGGGGVFQYTYDVLDNIRSAKLDTIKQHNYYYDARNRMTTVNRDDGSAIIGLDYDVQGNLAKKNGEVFRFDYGNRLRDAAGKELYAYDAHGRRVGNYSALMGDILSFYSNDGILRRQHNKRTGKELEYVSLGSSLIAELESVVAVAAPTLSGPANVATGNYSISWTLIVNANRYELRHSSNAGANWSAAYNGTSTSHTVSGATGSRSYEVRACQGSNCSGWSATLVVQLVPVPVAAPGLAVPAAGLNGSYSIIWPAVAGATRYAVQERAGSGPWTTVHDAAGLSVALNNRPAGSYTYRGQACNVSGCSGWSAEQAMTVIYPSDSAPTITAPTTSSTGSFTVSWTAVAGSTRYEPQERLGTGAWANLVNTTATSLSISGKPTGNHGYQVRACNVAGCSPWSNIVTTAVLLPPAEAPAITLAMTNTSGSYSVSWNPVGGAVEYRLEERVGGGSWVGLQVEAATLHAVSGKENGTYGYRVQACNAGGCSNWSAETATTVLRVPSAATVITPATNNSGAWTVSWGAVATATSYQLEERLNGGTLANVYTGAALSWATSARGTGNHGYRARACNASGCGGYSAIVTTAVTLPPGSAPALTVPASNGNGSFSVSWGAVATSTRYELEEQVASAWTQQQSTSALSKALTGRATGTYPFRVRACNEGGCGAYSATGTVTVLLVPQSAPAVTAPASAPGAYTISWSAVSTATSYNVHQNINDGGWGTLGSHGSTSLGLNPGSSGSYAYRVQACNATGCGGWSSAKTVAVQRPPSTPSMSYANQNNYYAGPHNAEYSFCEVGWTAVSYADRYELHAHGGIMLYDGSATSVSGQQYTIQFCAPVYVVRACNASGCSGFSAPMNHTLTQDPHPGDGGGVIP
jgi:YD repeat-containing protein